MSPKAKEYTERINVFFSKEQLRQIEAEAEKLGLTVSAYVRMVTVKFTQPEIVRCKDCLYGLRGIPYRCRLAHDTDSENWYCADAKKKDGCCEGGKQQ